MKSLNLPKPLKNLHKNKGVLYGLFALSLVIVLTYLSMSKLYPVLIFAIVSLGLKCYTNNMVIVLLSGIISAMLFSAYTCVKEGMTNKEGSEGEEDTQEEDENDTDECKPDDERNHCKGKGKKSKENMSALNPKSLDGDDSPYVDTASTLGVAYKNFEDILGSDGITKLSEETQRLAKQQTQLVKAMNQMGPMVKQMQGVMKDVNVDGNIKNSIGQLQGMLKNLS